MSATKVGFIGLGSQGGPIAERMRSAGGFPLTVWARRPEVAAEYASKGAQAVGTIEEVGAACDHIGICVVNDADVLEVCNKLIPAMREGSLLAIHSTILPQTSADLDARCAEHGIRFMDAPVSGGQPGAEAGTMTIMCGGGKEAFEQARPVFESFGKLIVLLGEAGAGQRAKIINNTLMSANMGLAHAAVAAGEKLGIDKAVLAELINASSGRSFGFEVYARLPSPQAFAVGAPMLDKDAKLLASILPDDRDSDLLKSTADYFLGPANAG